MPCKISSPYGFDVYKVNFKTIRTIAHIFVAFSEKLNFTNKSELEAGSSVKKHSDIEFS